MRAFLRQSFVWQFAGGFALGTAALLALQPPDARHQLARHLVPHRPAAHRG